MKLVFSNINESSYGDRPWSNGESFADYDYVRAADGTLINTKLVIAYVNRACDTLIKITQGEIGEWLAALPIIYTFEIPTMATDSNFIFINPGFVLELYKMAGNTVRGIAFVIMHEVYHNLYLHRLREAADPVHFTNHSKANSAQDYEINLSIELSHVDPLNPGDAVFAGITKECQGLIDEKYAGMTWEEIYDEIGEAKTNSKEKEKDPQVIAVSNDYKDGYRDGWEAAKVELRARGLIESVQMPSSWIYATMMLNEGANSKDYDIGYDEGYQAAMNALLSVLNPQPGGGTSPNSVIEQIPGLDPIKPAVPIPPQPASNNPVKGPNNSPIDISNAPKQQDPIVDPVPPQGPQGPGQDGPQGPGQNGPQGPQGPQGPGQDGPQGPGQNGPQGPQGPQGPGQNGPQGPGQDGPRSQDPNAEGNSPGSGQTITPGSVNINAVSEIEKIKAAHGNVIKVGVANGRYSGKAGMNDGEHTVEESVGQVLAKNAGYEDPTDDPSFAGKNSKITHDPRQIFDKLKAEGRGLLGEKPPRGLMDKIKGTIEGILKPAIDWKKELKKKLKGAFTEMIDAGFVKKGLARGDFHKFQDKEGETARRFIFCVDTSGSVVREGKYFEQIVTEISNIAKGVGARHFDLILFNTHVYRHVKYTARDFPDDFAIVEPSTGGTHYDNTFEYIEKNFVKKKKSFQAVLMFTDMDVKGSRLPKISWNPKKLIWLVLNDSDSDLKLPYGKLLTVSQKDFKNGLDKNYMTTNESIKVPRRGKITSMRLSEGIFDDDLEEVPDDIDTYQPTREDIRRDNIAAIVATGGLNAYKNEIGKWLKAHTNIENSWDFSLNDKFEIVINNDLLLSDNKNCFAEWRDDICFASVGGKLAITDSRISQLPEGLPRSVGKGVDYINLPCLKNFVNSPASVQGADGVYIDNCPALTDTTGLASDVKTIFDTSHKISYRNFRRGSLAASESLNTNLSFNRIVESRIAAGKKFNNSLNEAFSSSNLRNLQKNPKNAEAFRVLRSLPIAWSEIPDEIIDIRRGGDVGKMLSLRRDVNGNGEWGVYIFCDKTGEITVIATGNNRNNMNSGGDDWGGGNSWLYLRSDVLDTIRQRSNLVVDAVDAHDYAAEAECERIMGRGKWSKTDVVNAARKFRYSRNTYKSNLVYAHLYMIPDLCDTAYIIQGTKDPIPVDSHDVESIERAERMKNFSYASQRKRMNYIHNSRKDANAGVYMPMGTSKAPSRLYTGAQKQAAKDPKYKEYLNNFITDEILNGAKNAGRTLRSAKNYLEQLIDTMKDNQKMVRDAIWELADDDNVPERVIDGLYSAFVVAPVSKFMKAANEGKTDIESRMENGASAYNRYSVPSKRFSDTLPAGKNIVRNTDRDEALPARREWSDADDVKGMLSRNTSVGISTSGVTKWFKLYYRAMQRFAKLMSYIDAYSLGDITIDDLALYAEETAGRLESEY